MIIGRLGRNPEMRYTQSGMAVANFSVATTEIWNDRDSGEKKERTEWHRVVAFGKLGEICGQYLNKGKLVYIEGRLQTRDWEDRDGNKRYTTEIVANEMKMLSPKGESEYRPRATGSGQSREEETYTPPTPAYPEGPDDSDIPF